MYTSKLNHIFTAPVILAASLISSSAFSITFQGKPDFPVDSAEFGQTLAKHGKYIVVGADRHAEFGRSNQSTGDWTTNRNVDGGAIYLLTDDNSEPIKKYQFLKDPTLAPDVHISHLASPLNFSSQVDITDNWIVATLTQHYNPTTLTSQPAVVVIPKINGQFTTCPTSAYVTGVPGNQSTQQNWGNVVNCTAVSSTNVSSGILIVPLPPEFYGNLGRNVKIKVSGNAFAVATPNRLVSYHRNSTSSQWQLIQTFVPDAGKIISDIDLNGQYLAIGVNSANGPISFDYSNPDGVLDNNDFIFDYSGKVYTFKLSQSTATTAGVLSSGGLGFGLRVALNQNTLIVGSGGIQYPAQYFTVNPHISSTPLPIGKVHQYKFDTSAAPGQNAWLNRGYGEFTSTPIQLSLDENVLAVQLYEVGQTVSSPYIAYEPNVMAKLFYKIPGQDPAFNLGTGAQDKSIYKSQLEAARPYYSQTDVTAIDPVRVANGSVIIGWRAAKGDISNLFPLNGSIFQVNLTEL